MRFSLPSPALVVACLALLVAAGGVSYAATGSAINIVDPITATSKARVSSAGKLYVSDGAGLMSVDGTVSARPAAPLLPWRASTEIVLPTVIAGPSPLPINVTSLSVSTDASGSGIDVDLGAWHVPGTATNCDGATYDTTIWHIRDAGDGVTPLSFTFPTPLQWKPPANTKACLKAYEANALTTATMERGRVLRRLTIRVWVVGFAEKIGEYV